MQRNNKGYNLGLKESCRGFFKPDAPGKIKPGELIKKYNCKTTAYPNLV